MSVADLILQTANSLQMDPVDLGTILSYETAGTFDPVKRGPTTQWGQHRGLIQFGEPQARQYGVDWNDPLNSQLGPDGAVAKYFKGNGWQPGMGLLDAYSIVNAGAPGRYGASDANNGGAPGSVRDKVENQMDGHRRKAIALFGGAPASSGPAPTPNGNTLSFGDAVPQGTSPLGGGLAGMFDPRLAGVGMDMGVPAFGAPQAPAAAQMAEQEKRRTDQDRRISLADLIRY